MSSIRQLSIDDFRQPTPCPDGGAAPQLRWLDINSLYVDETYQREILGTGRANIQRIAREFNWAYFAPVVVSPMEGDDAYAIIDGQHRTIAAKVIGKERVPCSIVIADRREQAAAFKAINGNTTRMHVLQLHAAAVAAGDANALFIENIARQAGVRILRSPRQISRQNPGDTMAVASIVRAFETYGREVAVAILKILVSPSCREANLVNSDMIRGLGLVIHGRGYSPAVAIEQLAKINLPKVEVDARKEREKRGGRLSVLICEIAVRRLLALGGATK